MESKERNERSEAFLGAPSPSFSSTFCFSLLIFSSFSFSRLLLFLFATQTWLFSHLSPSFTLSPFLLLSSLSKPLKHCTHGFFFSSRRRHTMWNCDWSSDVCSSDLEPRPGAGRTEDEGVVVDRRPAPGHGGTERRLLRAEKLRDGRRERQPDRRERRRAHAGRRRDEDRKSGVEGKSGGLGGRRRMRR